MKLNTGRVIKKEMRNAMEYTIFIALTRCIKRNLRSAVVVIDLPMDHGPAPLSVRILTMMTYGVLSLNCLIISRGSVVSCRTSVLFGDFGSKYRT